MGYTEGTSVLLDLDAAGYGWFIDATPADDAEFRPQKTDGVLTAGKASEADGDMDLLTVVMHELGHVLGYDDLDAGEADLMSATLDDGVRYDTDGFAGDGTRLVRMDGTDAAQEVEKPLAAVTTRQKNQWLYSWLLQAGQDDDTIGPNSKIKLVIPDEEES